MRTALLAWLISVLLPLSTAWAGDWNELYTQDGVTVSSKTVPDTKLVAFKGKTVYDEPIERVLYVLLDNEHRVEWVDRLYINEVIDRTTEFDYVIYQAFELPPIFSNRDYVYHGVATRNPESGAVTLQMQSIEHAKAPETVGVRAELVNSRYVLTPIDPTHTQVEVEIMTDPKGMMPAWLVNLIQKSWPLETLNGIRGQFAKSHVGSHKLPGMDDDPPPEEDQGPATDEAGTEDTAAPEEGAPEGEVTPAPM